MVGYNKERVSTIGYIRKNSKEFREETVNDDAGMLFCDIYPMCLSLTVSENDLPGQKFAALVP